MLLEFADLLSSGEFAQRARHPDFPDAFTRDSKLPLPALVAALMSMRSGSQQVSLDEFFAATLGESAPVRVVSDRAFDKARKKLHIPDDAREWGCACMAPTVRLVKSITSEGKVRVMVTNLTPEQVPTADFAALYHQRWRIEEAYKRLKHVLHLESVSGLSQQALIIDVAAKVLADNFASLMCLTAEKLHNMQARSRFCNRRYAARTLTSVLPSVLMMVGDVLLTITDALANLARNH